MVHRASSRRLRIVGAALIVLAILPLAACGQKRVALCDAGVRGTAIRFRTADGVRLAGAAIGKGDRGIVFANGWDTGGGAIHALRISYSRPLPTGGIFCTWLNDPRLAEKLMHRGFQLLLFDYRGTGRSEAGHGAAARRLDLDVSAAVAEARRRGVRHLVLMGGSLGGEVVIAAAPGLQPQPSAIVTLSAGGLAGTNTGKDYGNLDAAAAAKRLHVPLLLIAARGDKEIVVDDRALRAAAANDGAELDIMRGSAHSTALLGNAAVRARVVRFIDRHSAR